MEGQQVIAIIALEAVYIQHQLPRTSWEVPVRHVPVPEKAFDVT